MKRTINFSINNGKYIFLENETTKIEIDIEEKILNGNDLYTTFFKKFDKDDEFVFNDLTTDDEKKQDKLCEKVYDKIKSLFGEIEKDIKEQIYNEEESTTSDTNV